MQCINCEAKWETKDNVTITKCPFCGESPLTKKEEPKFYETSKDALAAIYKKFGADILLGKLNAYLPDFAPSINNNLKKLVYSVYDSGASKTLKENLNGSPEDKERAVKIAVRTLSEAFVKDEIAEEIIHEFAGALGWKINKASNSKAKKTNDNRKNRGAVLAADKGNGKAKKIKKSGNIYKADLAADRKNNKIIKKFDNGDIYEGNWVNGKKHGKGKYIWSSGAVYEGDWVNGNQHGKGKFKWLDGEIYEGDFINGKKTGKGKYTYPSGAVYEGDWADDKRTGKGILKCADGTVKEGLWENNGFVKSCKI